MWLRRNKLWLVNQFGALLALAALSSCIWMPAHKSTLGRDRITEDMLLDSSPLAAGMELADLSGIDMLELNPEMIKFVDDYVDSSLTPHARLQRLQYLVMGAGKFDLVYDDTTRTAQETFREQHGNCLSFTNMFVAMARHLDLNASFQEVEIPPDWSFSGQAFLLSQHVNVYVDFRHYSPRVVDFNVSYDPNVVYDYNIIYERRVISDQRARAHYFNNIGVEYMLLGGDTLMALANFRESLKADSTFSPAWINLGILHRRDGHAEHAEAAYLKALEFDSSNLVAMSNLASLYEDQGYTEWAKQYRSRVQTHRMRNPYYRYQLAQEDIVAGDYESARSHLRYAIRNRKNEDRFCFLMSVSYALSGDQAAAREWMAKAEELSQFDSDRRRYQHKLDMLMGSGSTKNQ